MQFPTYAAGTESDNANAYWNNIGAGTAIRLDLAGRKSVSGSGPGSITEFCYGLSSTNCATFGSAGYYVGRPNSVNAQAAGAFSPTSYVAAVARTPSGTIQWMGLGNGLTEETCYNDHQQPFVIRQRCGGPSSCQTGASADGNDVGYLNFTFPAANNNGNITGQYIQYGAGVGYPAMSFRQLTG